MRWVSIAFKACRRNNQRAKDDAREPSSGGAWLFLLEVRENVFWDSDSLCCGRKEREGRSVHRIYSYVLPCLPSSGFHLVIVLHVAFSLNENLGVEQGDANKTVRWGELF